MYHMNMAHSLFETVQVWQYTADSVTVAWAPFTHVYGLTTGLLVPLYSGSHAVLMSPFDFLMNPIDWLKAIQNLRPLTSGCPNFGYEFCVEHIDEEEAILEKLNLNHWRVAANGGELVQLETMTKFIRNLKSLAFRKPHLSSVWHVGMYGVNCDIQTAGKIYSLFSRSGSVALQSSH